MKSKVLTFFFILIISIQMIPVIELASYVSKIYAQNEMSEEDFETEEDATGKDTLFKIVDLDILHPHSEITRSNQQNLIIIDTQALHQFFATIPTPPPLFS